MLYKHPVAVVPTLRDTWRGELREQGRTLRWLARATDTPEGTVYAYSIGKRTPPDEWLAKAAQAMGLEFIPSA